MRWMMGLLMLAISCCAQPAIAGNNAICFPVRDGEAILQEVEEGRAARVEAQACREWQSAHAATDQARAAACAATAGRLDNAIVERDAAQKQAKDNLYACRKAVEASRGSWWDRVKVRVTWAGIGAAAAVAGKILLLGGL